jgi:uncharacterized protein (TIGR02996 family)
MSHDASFLQAILDDPDDDAVRLIYADWLQERDDPRGEFIRLQCALANGVNGERRSRLEAREQELLRVYEDDWTRPLTRAGVKEWSFHRGFVDRIRLSVRQYLEVAERLSSLAPAQHLELRMNGLRTRAPEQLMPALADCSYLERIRSLDLSHNRLTSPAVRALVVSEYLGQLTHLNLAHNAIGDDGLRALASSPLFGRLTHLDLGFNDFGTNGIRALAAGLQDLEDSGRGARLTSLNITNARVNVLVEVFESESPILRRVARW